MSSMPDKHPAGDGKRRFRSVADIERTYLPNRWGGGREREDERDRSARADEARRIVERARERQRD